MTLSDETRARICALIYPIQFEVNPLNGVDRVIEVVVHARVLDATRQEYIGSIAEALASDIQLSNLIPQNHSEKVIRGFLLELKNRLSILDV